MFEGLNSRVAPAALAIRNASSPSACRGSKLDEEDHEPDRGMVKVTAQ